MLLFPQPTACVSLLQNGDAADEAGWCLRVPLVLPCQVVGEMTPAERSALLRFATSISRAPLGGFRFLQPPLTIHKVSQAQYLSLLPSCILPSQAALQ
jgi:hypothetical protein